MIPRSPLFRRIGQLGPFPPPSRTSSSCTFSVTLVKLQQRACSRIQGANFVPYKYNGPFMQCVRSKRMTWMQTQHHKRCSGVLQFSLSSESALAEKNQSDPCSDSSENALSSTDIPSQNDLESSFQKASYLVNNANGDGTKSPKNEDFVQAGRKLRITRKRSNIEQRNGETGASSHKDHFNGYRYRLLKTPQLTNDLISLPTHPEESAAPTDATPMSPQIMKKEDHDMRQLQQQYANESIREQPKNRFPTGIGDFFSSTWWRTLHQNIGSAQTASSIQQHPVMPPFQSSIRNRRSSLILEEIINNQSYSGFLPDERQHQEEEGIEEKIRVRSVQAASSIDVVAVLSKVFGGGVPRASQYTQTKTDHGNNNNNPHPFSKNQHPLSDFFATSPPVRHVFGRTNIIIQLSPPPLDNCHPSLSHSVPRYVAIYRFGSVVFFNLTTKEASRLLEQIKKHSANPIAVGFERREHFEVALQPELETATGKISADRAMVRELDMNTVGIVSNIMGQTVALDWHNDTVDELLANFSNVNSSVERTGGFTSMERHMLFQVVARNNSLFIEMVGKLGIKDRSDTAWHLSQYEGLHEGMRKEFDLDERFRNVEFKLNLIQQNAKFFLEVLHAQKSNTLEWVIIVLISFECVLMILDMSGWGTQMFSGWSFF